jgi:transcriptional regulator with XRE-family HTH domain
MELGQKIKSIREAIRMSQEEFGNEIGCSQVAISAWEAGRRSPNYKWIVEIERVAKKFKVKMKLI